MAAQLTGADRCVVAMLEGGQLAVRASLRMPEVEGELAWREAVDAVVKGAGPTLVQPANRGAGSPERGDEIRLGHGLTTPLRQGDKLFGAVYVDKELCGGVFTPHDLDLLTIFSAQAATMLENARVAEELRLAFRSRAATLEAISDGVLSLDKRGKLTSINAVAARILGTTHRRAAQGSAGPRVPPAHARAGRGARRARHAHRHRRVPGQRARHPLATRTRWSARWSR